MSEYRTWSPITVFLSESAVLGNTKLYIGRPTGLHASRDVIQFPVVVLLTSTNFFCKEDLQSMTVIPPGARLRVTLNITFL